MIVKRQYIREETNNEKKTFSDTYGGGDAGDGGMQQYAGDGKYPDHSGG